MEYLIINTFSRSLIRNVQQIKAVGQFRQANAVQLLAVGLYCGNDAAGCIRERIYERLLRHLQRTVDVKNICGGIWINRKVGSTKIRLVDTAGIKPNDFHKFRMIDVGIAIVLNGVVKL